jgi:protein phosphatase
MTQHVDAPANPSIGRALHVRATQLSDVGLVRTENQDFAMLTTPEEESDARLEGRLLIVADGMGGHRGGATASKLAATTIKAEFLSTDRSDIQQSLRRALESANARIFSEAQSNPDLRGMGTTCSTLFTRDDTAYVAHVGDSRIYLVRGGAIRQLTQDHSLVASMVREGLITSEEAETHPRRNILQRSMGVSEQVEVDVMQPLTMREGDTFVLCSDGLHGLVKEDEILGVLEVAGQEIEVGAQELIRRALSRGAPDNVTVIVARVDGSDAPRAFFRRTSKAGTAQRSSLQRHLPWILFVLGLLTAALLLLYVFVSGARV